MIALSAGTIYLLSHRNAHLPNTQGHITHVSFLFFQQNYLKFIRKGKSDEDFLRLFMRIKKKEAAALGREKNRKKPETSPTKSMVETT